MIIMIILVLHIHTTTRTQCPPPADTIKSPIIALRAVILDAKRAIHGNDVTVVGHLQSVRVLRAVYQTSGTLAHTAAALNQGGRVERQSRQS